MVLTLSCTGVARLFLALHDILDSRSSPVRTHSSVDARQVREGAAACTGPAMGARHHGESSQGTDMNQRHETKVKAWRGHTAG
jgi:hypothetical protein